MFDARAELLLICDCWSSLTPAGRNPGGENYKSRVSICPESTSSPATISGSVLLQTPLPPLGPCPAQALPSLHAPLSAVPPKIAHPPPLLRCGVEAASLCLMWLQRPAAGAPRAPLASWL